MSAPLSGRCIWLTRAAHQAEPWARALENAGAKVLREPLMAIEPPADRDAARRGLAVAADADIVFATSSNAVQAAWRLDPGFAPTGHLYAVGAATGAAFETASGRPVARPHGGFSTEGLLAMPSLSDIAGRRVVILAGEGGRTTLAAALAERGAEVHKVALYRRKWLQIDPERLAASIDAVDAVIVTSGEALTHLLDQVFATNADALAARLAECRLVAPSARVVKQANQRLSWTHTPVIVERIGGDAIVASLARVWKGDRQ
ncbi:uroporphyrinogen-III synthase [Endozoicomonas sp. G2_2]|uniref:uroporphyrinogen-III synthase n=1 Tax=Endozoicomonas sp. G2_2 TaxID=2821092 RepID=UPI001ADBD15E|nr:uroporphyrinogen-III synthase [Endozoicomonas sp. G2_2]MBO9468870.1 uroporphyrinogen-III synthase [Endozoicomonas sp. G2_2]